MTTPVIVSNVVIFPEMGEVRLTVRENGDTEHYVVDDAFENLMYSVIDTMEIGELTYYQALVITLQDNWDYYKRYSSYAEVPASFG